MFLFDDRKDGDNEDDQEDQEMLLHHKFEKSKKV